MHARNAPACAPARTRAHAYRPYKPVTRRDNISLENRLFRPVPRGFCPDGRPTGPVFAPLAALSPEKSAGKPGPGAAQPLKTRLFRPDRGRAARHTARFPPRRCASAAGSARVSAVPAAACPDRHTDGPTHAPVFRPAAPAPARPTHRPGVTARRRPASGPPRHRLQRFALVKGCVTPRGDQIPGLFGWRPRPTLA